MHNKSVEQTARSAAAFTGKFIGAAAHFRRSQKSSKEPAMNVSQAVKSAMILALSLQVLSVGLQAEPAPPAGRKMVESNPSAEELVPLGEFRGVIIAGTNEVQASEITHFYLVNSKVTPTERHETYKADEGELFLWLHFEAKEKKHAAFEPNKCWILAADNQCPPLAWSLNLNAKQQHVCPMDPNGTITKRQPGSTFLLFRVPGSVYTWANWSMTARQYH